MSEFRFDHLSPTEFEEFCYDLLAALGATKLNWRKGTGFASSPADRGRDIECEFRMPEVGGEYRTERWYVECKHQKAGVPPQKISGALAWADANKPDCLLLIASGFFSNPCKDLIEKHRQNNSSGFRIKLWEKKDCERYALSVPEIFQKYKIFEKSDMLAGIHPVHSYYLRWPPYNSLKYLFEIMERVGPERLKNTFGLAFLGIVNPSTKPQTDSEQTLGELLTKPITYSEFCRKCMELSPLIDQGFLVQGIICNALSSGFHLADESDLPRQIDNCQKWLEEYAASVEAGASTKQDYDRFSKTMADRIARLPEQVAESKIEYRELCELVVSPLLLEEYTGPLDFFSAHPKPPDQTDSDLDDVPF